MIQTMFPADRHSRAGEPAPATRIFTCGHGPATFDDFIVGPGGVA